MLDPAKIIGFVIPEKIQDINQKVVDFKLALGAATGLSLIIGAFLILAGVFQLTMESFNGFQISNATILILLGVAVVWFTLTKIGVKPEDSNKN
jgi:hypothetical protein